MSHSRRVLLLGLGPRKWRRRHENEAKEKEEEDVLVNTYGRRMWYLGTRLVETCCSSVLHARAEDDGVVVMIWHYSGM